MSNKDLYIRLTLRFLFFSLFIVFLFFLPSLFSIFAPFIFALMIAALLSRPIAFISSKWRVQRRFASYLLVILVFFSFLSLITWIIYMLVVEAIRLADDITTFTDFAINAFDALAEIIKNVTEYLPGDSVITIDSFTSWLANWLTGVSAGFAENVFAFTSSFTTGVGSVIISITVFVLAAFFLAADYHKIGDFFRKHSGSFIYERMIIIKNTAKHAFGGYLKAQLILTSAAFVIFVVAFSVIGQEYAFLLAFILSIIDFIPFIGSSVLLLPWSVYCIIDGDYLKAVFLMVISSIVYFTRRLAEPKIVSTQTGITPLLSLFAMYIGFKLIGILGLFFGPIIVIIVISVMKSGIFDESKKDLADLAIIIATVFKREP